MGSSRAERARTSREVEIRWTAAILVAGFAAGLFSIVIYQVFNFFGVSWILFANLLFMGFPLGGYVFLRWIDDRPHAFGVSLTLLLAAMVGSIGLLFLLKYPTTWWASSLWSPAAVVGLVKLSLATALPFLVFFVAYGAMEVAGYRAGQAVFGEGNNRVYALYLLGLALGYALFSLVVEDLGVLRMALVAVASWGAARVLVSGPLRWLGPAALIGAAGLCLLPLQDFFFRALHPSRLIGASGGIELDAHYRVIHHRWDRAGHVTLLDSNEELLGAYLPVVAWGFDRTRPAYGPGDLRGAVFRGLPADANVLIIGTGGGVDVAGALRFRPRQIVAVEIRASVMDALRGEFSDRVNHVYNQPNVTPVVGNGRRYLERTDERFDLIYLPAVDSLVINTRTLFDASEHMHTLEAFAQMKQRLAPAGTVAVARRRDFDPGLRQFERIFTHLEQVGLRPLGLLSPEDWVLLGFDLPEGAALPDLPGDPALQRVQRVTALADRPPPVHDDRPYGAGIPGAIVPEKQIALIFCLQLLIFGAITGGVWSLLSRGSMMARWPVEGGRRLLVASLLVGTNFLALEYQAVFVLLRGLDQPFDAIFLATIAFLLVTSLGSLTRGRLSARVEAWAAALGLAAALVLQIGSPGPLQLLCLAPAAFATGRFFPEVFGVSRGRRLRVFAMDSVGAFLATILAAFVPILFGFTAYLVLVGAVFLLTLAAVSGVHDEKDRGDSRAGGPNAPGSPATHGAPGLPMSR